MDVIGRYISLVAMFYLYSPPDSLSLYARMNFFLSFVLARRLVVMVFLISADGCTAGSVGNRSDGNLVDICACILGGLVSQVWYLCHYF